MSDTPKTLIITVGLPRSGKSTWARKSGFPVVNPDAIRLSLFGSLWEDLAEGFVWAIAEVMVRALFVTGHDTVVLDATNVTKFRRDKWLWPSKWEGRVPRWVRKYQVFDTSKEVCMQRAVETKQEHLLPVIEKMASDYEEVGVDEWDV